MAGRWSTQSAAILRYVAKLNAATNLYPADPLLAARVDAVCDLEADAFVGVRVSKYKERFGFGFLNEDKYAGELAGVAEALNKEVVPRHLTNLAKVLEAGKTGWLGGTRGRPSPTSSGARCWTPSTTGGRAMPTR